jgi:GNAT superfamily N-acetyltransferase
VSGAADISVLSAPISDAVLEQLASVLLDCVEGGASVSFMAPFTQEQGLAFFRKVANSVVAGDTVLLAAKLDGKIIGTVQLGLDTPPNQPHRADVKKMLVHRSSRGRGVGADLMARVEAEPGNWAAGCWCSTPCPATTAIGFIGAPAGPRVESFLITRCFRMGGCATRPCSGSGWIDS